MTQTHNTFSCNLPNYTHCNNNTLYLYSAFPSAQRCCTFIIYQNGWATREHVITGFSWHHQGKNTHSSSHKVTCALIITHIIVVNKGSLVLAPAAVPSSFPSFSSCVFPISSYCTTPVCSVADDQYSLCKHYFLDYYNLLVELNYMTM